MSVLLDNPGFRQRIARMSVERYHQLTEQGLMPQKAELIRGYVFTKMSKSPLHSCLCHRCVHMLESLLPPGLLVRRNDPLSLADSVPEPDVAVVAGEVGDFLGSHPSTALLVIEVAVTTASEDREMSSIYAEAGIPDHWIVLGAEKKVEIRRSPSASGYQEVAVCGPGEQISISSIPGVRFSLDELFSGV